MADPTQLDRIEAAQASLAADIAGLRSLLLNIVTREIQIMSNQDIMKAALDAVATATSQEAALLTANLPKLDKIQALITDLVNTAGVPQSMIDQAAAIQAAIADVVTTTTAQAGRLDVLGNDPRNPVPTPPPAA
jgi:hypothetical protein